MNYFLGLTFCLFIFISCKESPETKFSKEGISFICPKGWKITDEEKLDSTGYFISIERDGISSSGLHTITSINGFYDLNEYLIVHIRELKNNIVYKNSNIQFSKIKDTTFNDIKCKSVTFNFKLAMLAQEGRINVFFGTDKTISILTQQAMEEKKKNKDGIEVFEKSFKVD